MPRNNESASTLGNGFDGLARFSLRLFGGFQLALLSGERVLVPGRRERMLLAYLAMSPNCRQPRQKLAVLFWGDSPEEIALHNLRTCVWNLRKGLGDSEHRTIASEGEVIVLDTAAFEIDALAFRRLATHPSQAELEAAANLYSGEFLDGLDIESEELESWRRAEATRYKDQAIDVLARLMIQLARCGEKDRAIAAGERLLRLEPLHEIAVRQLMYLYSETGRRGTAVQHYRRLADALRKELDTEPEAETGLVFAEITRGSQDRTAELEKAEATRPPREIGETASSNTTAGPLPPARPTVKSHVRPVILALLLIVGVASVSYRQFVTREHAEIADTQRPGIGTAPAASITQAVAISIAVLPFTNLSGDATQEFLSDGITEEITAALAKAPHLQVVARASAYQFKSKRADMREAGRSLGARYLVDGSVRKAGTHVRITAQLIRTDSGVNVWSNRYDRELTDMFAIQEDIARAVAVALRTPLRSKSDENLVNNSVIDEETYLQFLQAKALGVNRLTDETRRSEADALLESVTARAKAVTLLESIVARNPNFAPAWGQLALNYQRMPLDTTSNDTAGERRRAVELWLAKSDAAAEQAIKLDQTALDGYSSLGLTMAFRGRFLQAEDFLTKALALDPNDPETLHTYANVLSTVGRYKESLAMRERLLSIEPLVPVYRAGILGLLWRNSETDALAVRLKMFPEARQLAFLAKTYAAAGDYGKAADTLMGIRNGYPDGMVANAARLMRTGSATASPLPQLTGDLRIAYVRVGAWERILQPLEDGVAAGYLAPITMNELWEPGFAPLRRTERFKTLARNYGLVEYWRAKGWPDQCHPVGAEDFACN